MSYFIHCILYSIQCTVYTTMYELIVQCTPYNIRRTLHDELLSRTNAVCNAQYGSIRVKMGQHGSFRVNGGQLYQKETDY